MLIMNSSMGPHASWLAVGVVDLGRNEKPSFLKGPKKRDASTAKNKGKKWKSWEYIFCFVFMCGQNPKIAEYHNSIM